MNEQANANQGLANKVEAYILERARKDTVRVYGSVAGAAAEQVYRHFLEGAIAAMLEKAREVGKQHRGDIELGALQAIDRIVDWDIPGIPDSLEVKLDPIMKEVGHAMVCSTLDMFFGEDGCVRGRPAVTRTKSTVDEIFQGVGGEQYQPPAGDPPADDDGDDEDEDAGDEGQDEAPAS